MNYGESRKPQGICEGAAWLSSARAVRCRLKCHNERNPCCQLLTGSAEDSDKTAIVRCEEGGDDVKSACKNRKNRTHALSQIQSHKHGFLIVPDFFVHLYFHKLPFLSPVLFSRFLWLSFRYFYPGKSTVFCNSFRVEFRKPFKVKCYLLIGCIS